MNYLKIDRVDECNGDGLRVVLWLSGCSLHCPGCQNPQTWDKNSGIKFDEEAKKELFEALAPSYISGITLTGGHPLEEYNIDEVLQLIKEIKQKYPTKTIWIYTGLMWEDIFYNSIQGKFLQIMEAVQLSDILVDGPYIEALRDTSLPWVGSSNQRVIDIQRSLKEDKIILKEK